MRCLASFSQTPQIASANCESILRILFLQQRSGPPLPGAVVGNADDCGNNPGAGYAPPQALAAHAGNIHKHPAQADFAHYTIQNANQEAQLHKAAAHDHCLERTDDCGNDEVQNKNPQEYNAQLNHCRIVCKQAKHLFGKKIQIRQVTAAQVRVAQRVHSVTFPPGKSSAPRYPRG